MWFQNVEIILKCLYCPLMSMKVVNIRLMVWARVSILTYSMQISSDFLYRHMGPSLIYWPIVPRNSLASRFRKPQISGRLFVISCSIRRFSSKCNVNNKNITHSLLVRLFWATTSHWRNDYLWSAHVFFCLDVHFSGAFTELWRKPKIQQPLLRNYMAVRRYNR